MVIAKLKQTRLYHHVLKLGDFFPAIFFFGGFLWDALTIGRNVASSDLITFFIYLLIAAAILFTIGSPRFILGDVAKLPPWLAKIHQRLYWKNLPYFMLQFMFGNLLSALFILYFKSANHWLAWFMSVILGLMLVANEYLEDEYKRFTLSWALFGFCAMLLFNFAIPYLMGSIHAVWFYSSTILGAAAAYWLYKKTPNHDGSIKPVGLIAAVLMLAYAFDVIPPVPLVKRDIAVGYALNKIDGNYQLSQQPSNWWVFWQKTSNDLKVVPGQRVYCFSSVFAPSGLKTRLYHRWQYYDKKAGWQTKSRIGFTLSGGRYDGFRGYTYKTDLQAGDWKVSVETENDKTVAVQEFSVETVTSELPAIVRVY
ncbi:DUF2914 domain-containing protein [Methylotenera sp.]|uniref:DUF2914 domain-containing protein n=1 Tax=Methylotenera sp. TaxID=2051956 RepID=UPI002727C2A3|nr:DUF2914 domain-containing protein [Methylotenera sp.]MDO9205657.1 DUF2914 domain-containing protein [Methylotenera sp.]MDO9394640.1 DUF2914 domain-containing protein [Methylotenera sp.]MDP1522607.1 DUF2914 domain-containing protein [Methylotenera sp.]MDP2070415.1 DUF2914 domain-containing protein [Methylotenera sp.]MDP2230190.1 DUF2914 domain-containing protein [Methylotenera sp.]